MVKGQEVALPNNVSARLALDNWLLTAFPDILYLSSPTSTASLPSDLLKPYLQRITSESLFESYYISSRTTSNYSASSPKVIIVTPFYGDDLITEGLDWEAKEAEKAYYSVVGQDGVPFFGVRESETDEMGIFEDD